MGMLKTIMDTSRQARKGGSLSTAGWTIFWNVLAAVSVGVNFFIAGKRFGEGEDGFGWLGLGIIVLLLALWSWSWMLQWYNTYNAGAMSVYRERRDKHFESANRLVSRSMGGR